MLTQISAYVLVLLLIYVAKSKAGKEKRQKKQKVIHYKAETASFVLKLSRLQCYPAFFLKNKGADSFSHTEFSSFTCLDNVVLNKDTV